MHCVQDSVHLSLLPLYSKVVELRTLNGVLLSERRLAAGALNHGNQPIAASPNVADEPKVFLSPFTAL